MSEHTKKLQHEREALESQDETRFIREQDWEAMEENAGDKHSSNSTQAPTVNQKLKKSKKSKASPKGPESKLIAPDAYLDPVHGVAPAIDKKKEKASKDKTVGVTSKTTKASKTSPKTSPTREG